MKLQLTIDDDQADAIVREQLLTNIRILKEEQHRLTVTKKRTKAENRELMDANLYLIALENTYEYYGGKHQMTTLPKEIKADVTALKKLVRQHQKIEDKEFNAICKWLKIDPEGPESDGLFDYIYNDSKWVVEFK